VSPQLNGNTSKRANPHRKVFGLFLLIAIVGSILPGFSQAIDPATAGLTTVELFPGVQSGSFVEGSTFEVPFLINTRGADINTVTLNISYDPNKLSVVDPSGGKSIVGLWFDPPSYDNATGLESLGGIITNGITTNAGLITTITFKVRGTGETVVQINSSSRVLLNDGLGTDANISTIRGVYTLLPSPPGAVTVYSQTHPLQDRWYNNPSPVLTWDQDPAVSRFAYVLDNKPHTIPSDEDANANTQQDYKDLSDGTWYFHIKGEKQGVWGATSDFRIQIDTTPPAAFKPTVNYLTAGNSRQAHVSFLTTDSASGIDYYEVGTNDLSDPNHAVPVFTQVTSPYQIQLGESKRQQVTVRAIDRAGNVLDKTVMVRAPWSLTLFFKTHTSVLLGVLLGSLFFLAIFHYVIGHRLIARLKLALRVFRDPKLPRDLNGV
jgi:hypothetical protein